MNYFPKFLGLWEYIEFTVNQVEIPTYSNQTPIKPFCFPRFGSLRSQHVPDEISSISDSLMNYELGTFDNRRSTVNSSSIHTVALMKRMLDLIRVWLRNVRRR
jgi:hypothetical protein